jgi:hypothetical protein
MLQNHLLKTVKFEAKLDKIGTWSGEYIFIIVYGSPPLYLYCHTNPELSGNSELSTG